MKKLYMVSWPSRTKKSWTESNLHSKPRKIFKGLKIWFKNIVLSFPLTHFEINHFFWSFLTDWHHHMKYCDQNFRVYIKIEKITINIWTILVECIQISQTNHENSESIFLDLFVWSGAQDLIWFKNLKEIFPAFDIQNLSNQNKPFKVEK